MAEIEVVIPNWNGCEWLGGCLDSLRRQTFRDFRVIVVDNASSDGSTELVQTAYPEVELIQLPTNTGFTGGTNAGMQAGTAPYICWFNNDAEADPDFLEQLLIALRSVEAEGYGMAAARVLFQAEPDKINSAGSFVGPDGLGRDRAFRQLDRPPFDQPAELFGPAGVAALYKRAIFDEIGYLDEDFFLYNEEIDLNYRAQLAGYRCLYVPTARVVHRGSATARRISQQATRLASRNGLLAIIKNLPAPLLIWLSFWILVGQIYQLVLFARQGNLRPALKGKLEAIKLLGPTLAKRRLIQKKRRVSLSHFRRQMRLGRTTPRVLQKVISLNPKSKIQNF